MKATVKMKFSHAAVVFAAWAIFHLGHADQGLKTYIFKTIKLFVHIPFNTLVLGGRVIFPSSLLLFIYLFPYSPQNHSIKYPLPSSNIIV